MVVVTYPPLGPFTTFVTAEMFKVRAIRTGVGCLLFRWPDFRMLDALLLVVIGHIANHGLVQAIELQVL